MKDSCAARGTNIPREFLFGFPDNCLWHSVIMAGSRLWAQSFLAKPRIRGSVVLNPEYIWNKDNNNKELQEIHVNPKWAYFSEEINVITILWSRIYWDKFHIQVVAAYWNFSKSYYLFELIFLWFIKNIMDECTVAGVYCSISITGSFKLYYISISRAATQGHFHDQLICFLTIIIL